MKINCISCNKNKAGKWFYGYPQHTNKTCMVCFDKAQHRNGSYSLDALVSNGNELVPLDTPYTYKIAKTQDDSY